MGNRVQLPLDRVYSCAPFIILDGDLHFLSEHDTREEACKALARYVSASGDDALIMSRRDDDWAEL
jgi:hypothetical protein